MKALIIDKMSALIKPELEKLGFDVDFVMLPTSEKLAEIVEPYDLLCMRVDPFITDEVIDAAKNLKALMVGSTGLNHIKTSYYDKANKVITTKDGRKIPVKNSPGQNANAVAELVFCKALDIYRHSVEANNEVKYKRIWNKYRWEGRELRNKTMGIIGFGAIGRRVAEIAHVFHMDVVAFDAFIPAEKNPMPEIAKMVDDVNELIKTADIITLHVPLTPDTKDMISFEEMKTMKDGSVIINAARGGVVNEEALYENLMNGKLMGANIDTISNELGAGGLDTQDVPVESILFKPENLYVTPHIGGTTTDAQDDIGRIVIGNVKEVFGL